MPHLLLRPPVVIKDESVGFTDPLVDVPLVYLLEPLLHYVHHIVYHGPIGVLLLLLLLGIGLFLLLLILPTCTIPPNLGQDTASTGLPPVLPHQDDYQDTLLPNCWGSQPQASSQAGLGLRLLYPSHSTITEG